MSNQHNRSYDKVKQDARRARDKHQAAAMTQKLDLPDEDRQTGGAIVWLALCVLVILIIAAFIGGGIYFDRAEQNANKVAPAPCSQEK